MANFVAYTTIDLNLPVSSQTKYFNSEILDTSDALKKVYSYQTNYENVAFNYFNCNADNAYTVTKTMTETITIENFTGTLNKVPYLIDRIDVLVSFESVNGYNTHIEKIEGETITFNSIKTGIIEITYNYKVREFALTPISVEVGIRNGELPAAVFVQAEDDFSQLDSFSFTLERPQLSAEVFSNYILAKTAMSSTKAELKCIIDGGVLNSQEIVFTEYEEAIEFTDGVGYANYNVASVVSYEYISGDRGTVKKDKSTSNYYANTLSLVSSGVGGSGGLSGVYKVKYLSWGIKFYYSVTQDIGYYTITDALDNKVSGELQGKESEATKDIEIKVVDYLTHEPLKGARVTVANISAYTNEEGVAYLDGVPVGKQKVTIYKDGYIPNIQDNLANEYIDV